MSTEKEIHDLTGEGTTLRWSDLGGVNISPNDPSGVLATVEYADAVGTIVDLRLGAGTITPIVSNAIQVTATAVTANADGLTTAIIGDYYSFISVTSGDANHIVTLPTPTPGIVIRLMNGATGYELRSSDPATVGINGGVGAEAESAIAASTYVEMRCTTATNWVGTQYTAAGVASAVQVAAP